MRVGIVLLPELDWAVDRERWQRAEEYGFDHAWTYDHLSWRNLADGPWHAMVPTLVAAALATSRIRLGSFVTTPNFRHPVLLAKDLMTLDVISEGRVIVGMGAGTTGFDADVLGHHDLTPGQRFERFAEFHGLLDRLLSEPTTSWSGTYYEAVDAKMIPGPVQRPRPPFVVAANGPRGMRLAAESARAPGDGWVTLGPGDESMPDDEWWDGVRRTVARMEDTVSEAGLALPEVRMMNVESRVPDSAEHFRDTLGRAEELGFTDVAMAWPRASYPYVGNEHVLDEIAEDVLAAR